MSDKGNNSISWLFGKFYLWTRNDSGEYQATQITEDEIAAMEANA